MERSTGWMGRRGHEADELSGHDHLVPPSYEQLALGSQMLTQALNLGHLVKYLTVCLAI